MDANDGMEIEPDTRESDTIHTRKRTGPGSASKTRASDDNLNIAVGNLQTRSSTSSSTSTSASSDALITEGTNEKSSAGVGSGRKGNRFGRGKANVEESTIDDKASKIEMVKENDMGDNNGDMDEENSVDNGNLEGGVKPRQYGRRKSDNKQQQQQSSSPSKTSETNPLVNVRTRRSLSQEINGDEPDKLLSGSKQISSSSPSTTIQQQKEPGTAPKRGRPRRKPIEDTNPVSIATTAASNEMDSTADTADEEPGEDVEGNQDEGVSFGKITRASTRRQSTSASAAGAGESKQDKNKNGNINTSASSSGANNNKDKSSEASDVDSTRRGDEATIYPKLYNREHVETKDPYLGQVMWAKMHGHPHWPARPGNIEDLLTICTKRAVYRIPPQQRVILYDGSFSSEGFKDFLNKKGKLDTRQRDAKGSNEEEFEDKRKTKGSDLIGINIDDVVDEVEKYENKYTVEPRDTDMVCVWFLGSNQLGAVKYDQLLSYADNYHEFHHKSNGKPFLLALEESDGVALRNENPDGTGSCVVCNTSAKASTIILCDRCNNEYHLKCLNPPLMEVPKEDWFCPTCRKDAPLTIEQSKKEKRKKEMNENRTSTGGNSSNKGTEKNSSNIASSNSDKRTGDDSNNAPSSTTKRSRKDGDNDTNDTSNNAEPDTKKRKKVTTSSITMDSMEGGLFPIHLTQSHGKRGKDSFVNEFSIEARAAAIRMVQSTSDELTQAKAEADLAIQRAIRSKKKLLLLQANEGERDAQEEWINKNGKPKKSGKNSKRDRTCFICGEEGLLISCNFDHCPRAYHKFCLGQYLTKKNDNKQGKRLDEHKDKDTEQSVGSSSDGKDRNEKDKNNEEERRDMEESENESSNDDDNNEDKGIDLNLWCCPWHNCSCCGLREVSRFTGMRLADEKVSNPLLNIPQLDSLSFQPPIAMEPGKSISFSNQLGFVRCLLCPFALCKNHVNAPIAYPRRIAIKSKIHFEELLYVERKIQSYGFFICEECAGIEFSMDSSDSLSSSSSSVARSIIVENPITSLATLLDKCLSWLTIHHGHLVSPFICKPQMYQATSSNSSNNLQISEVTRSVSNESSNMSLNSDIECKSLEMFQFKIRRLQYKSVSQFKQDIRQFAESLVKLHKVDYPELAEAANTLPGVIDEVFSNMTTNRIQVEKNLEEEEKHIKDLENYFPVKEHTDTVYGSLSSVKEGNGKYIPCGARVWDGWNLNQIENDTILPPFKISKYNPMQWVKHIIEIPIKSKYEPSWKGEVFPQGDDIALAPRSETQGIISTLVSALEAAKLMSIGNDPTTSSSYSRIKSNLTNPLAKRQDNDDIEVGGNNDDEDNNDIGAVSTMGTGASAFSATLPPSRTQFEAMLEEQAKGLRAQLVMNARIRQAFSLLFTQLDESENSILPLGEGRVSAEYKVANNVLKAKVKQLQVSFMLLFFSINVNQSISYCDAI